MEQTEKERIDDKKKTGEKPATPQCPAAAQAPSGAEPEDGAAKPPESAAQPASRSRRRRKRSRGKKRAAGPGGMPPAGNRQPAKPAAPPPAPSDRPAKPVLPPASDMPVRPEKRRQPPALPEKTQPPAGNAPAEAASRAEAAAGPKPPADAGKDGKPAAPPLEKELEQAPPQERRAPPADLADPALDPAEQARRAEISRTAQMSIQQILDKLDQGEEAPPPDPADDAETEEELPFAVRLRDGLLRLLGGVFRWLLLVAALIALIAGAGLAWLYHQATADQIPALTVTFDGQTLETAAYSWQVPVVGNKFKRSYEDTLHEEPVALAETVDTAAPVLTVSPAGYTTALTVSDAAGAQVFSGTAMEFRNFRFEQNGEYTAELTAGTDRGGAQDAAVTGSQTYRFRFTVGIRPAMRINTRSALQGALVTVWVSDTQTDAVPSLTTDLGQAEFIPVGEAWAAFLPVPRDAAPGGYTVAVQADGYTEELLLTVNRADFGFRDVSYRSQRAAPFIGPEDTPAEVAALLDVADDTPAWRQTGFAQPFSRSVGVVLAYGEPEYVGRNATERAADIDNGTARVAENTLVETRWGDSLLCPADGRVLLAEDLGGDAGNTIVIEHGAGLKSIFYGLGTLQAAEGDRVSQGQAIALTRSRTIVEVRVGRVAVEPLTILRGECDALLLS